MGHFGPEMMVGGEIVIPGGIRTPANDLPPPTTTTRTAMSAQLATDCDGPTATSARRAAGSIRTDRSATRQAAGLPRLRFASTLHPPNMPARNVTRPVHEGARDLTREITASDAFLVSSRQRKKAEMLFAHLKRLLKRSDGSYAIRTEQETSSTSPRQPRTPASWLRSGRSKIAQIDKDRLFSAL